MNILLQTEFHTPHQTFPFELISNADIEEAILEGIKIEEAEIEEIVRQTATPTFENTLLPLSKTGVVLENATTLMYNQLSARTSDELEELAERMSPILSEHSSNIMLNDKLFARVKTIYEQEKANPTLEGEEAMFLQKTYDGFERSGATLSAEKKERFRAIKKELSQLSLQFSQNNIKETNAFILHLTNEDDLLGLPEGQIEQARLAAKERNLDGWVFTLHAPSYVPFLQYSARRELRERMYMAYMTKCTQENEYNNFEICRRLVNLRMELAQLLGYKHYADYVLKNRMAKRVEHVRQLLDELTGHYFDVAQQEVEAIQEFAEGEEGGEFELKAWDFAYYAHHLKLRDYHLDAEMLRPYFELSKVMDGVFGLATRLYGITFEENKEISVYDEEVKAYEVYDQDQSFLAVLYTDFFPRSSKQSGAWMTSYKEQYVDAEGGNHRPHVSVTMNFTKPTETKPALLTFDEVETFLHEFGHALHGIFAQTRFKALSGTSVYWDFVELPSQIMENFAIQPEFLNTFATHYQTGEALPPELIDRIRKAKNFNVAYACIRQLSFCLLDMAYHTLEEPLAEDIRTFEQNAWSSVQLLPVVQQSCMTTQFGHIMSGGYAAGYYSYKWAEVLEADAFEAFVEEGLFSREVAARFREHILSKGGTVHPETLYRNFRGRQATSQALLKRDGLK